MPTVIDQLIIELGLDPTKFTKGQRETADAFLKTRDQAKRTADEIEHWSEVSGEYISKLRGQVLGFTALLVGSRSISEFVEKNVKLADETGRTGRLIGMSTEKLSVWRGVAERSGGTAEGITSTIRGLSQEFQNFDLTGQSGIIPYLRSLQGQFPDLNLNIKNADGSMRDMTEFLTSAGAALSRLDPVKAAAFGRALHMDEGVLTTLLRSPAALKALLEEQEKINVITRQEAVAARELSSEWTKMEQNASSLARSILTKLTPALSGMLHRLGLMFKAHKEGKQLTSDYIANEDSSAEPPAVWTGETPKPRQLTGFPYLIGKVVNSVKNAAVKGYIVEAFTKQGIDPNVALAVAKSEGLDKYVGDQGTSFGPFQLHYKNNIPGLSNAGLGDEFTKQTGLDARDPSTLKEQIDFVAKKVRETGWTPWHGWKGSRWAGIPTGGAASAVSANDNSSSSTSTSETHIGKIEVHTQAKDATGIAKDIGPAIRTNSLATQAQYGSR